MWTLDVSCSCTRRRRPPTWPAATDAAPPSCRLAARPSGDRALPDRHGKIFTFIARLRRAGIVVPPVLEGLVTGRAFAPMSNRYWYPTSIQAMSWCSTQSGCLQDRRDPSGDRRCCCALSRILASGRRSRTRGCLPIHLTSTHDPAAAGSSAAREKPVQQDREPRWYSPSSRPWSKKAVVRIRHQRWAVIRNLLPISSAAECPRYLRRCGCDAI